MSGIYGTTKKGKYVSEADAIKEGSKKSPFPIMTGKIGRTFIIFLAFCSTAFRIDLRF